MSSIDKPNIIRTTMSSIKTPKSTRKNVTSREFMKLSSGHSDTNVKRYNSDSVLNTAFSSKSLTKTQPSSNANKKNLSTTLNACYTPSSLFRRTPTSKSGITPTSSTPRLARNNIMKNHNQNQKTPECFVKLSLDTSKLHSDYATTDKNDEKSEISNLKVAVRVRPLNSQECLNTSVFNVVSVENNTISVSVGTTADNTGGVNHIFHYDNIFWSVNQDDSHYANQQDVFRGIGYPLVEKAFEGYNACLFAYGQTGSGKSYSMMGIEANEIEDGTAPNLEAGIIPRFCWEIFRKISTLENFHAEIEISYFEIYNEKIHDLLSVSHSSTRNSIGHSNKKNALRVREHPIWGPYVVGLSTHPVNCYTSLRNWLAVGNSQRATAATGMNDQSSRSHSIFNIILNISEIEKLEENLTKFKETRRSKISLVDLAGSERISNMEGNGDRIREGVCINKSLLTLGKVISALADSKKGTTFVPYRESVLTWLLRESLGGNSRTVMLGTISPASIHLDETLATLRYAHQARAVINRVKVNEDHHDKVIRELRAEVERLKGLKQDYERQKRHSATNNQPRKIIIETSVDENEVEALRTQLFEMEQELAKAQKSWMERLKEAESQRKFEIRSLKRKGLALELSAEQKQPCLVNLTADPILSGILLYILPPGLVRIGRSKQSAFQQPDIILDGPLVAYSHCSIENINGNLFLMPECHDFETFLNGELVQKKQQIFDGDRLVIGGTHYFRVSNPFCEKRNKNAKNAKVIDYQLAHQEILQKQEEKLRHELDDEKKIALRKIELERAEYERNYREKYELLELEKFRFKCSKELLETEKKALMQNRQLDSDDDSKFEYTPFKSTLLDDIKRIIHEPTKESLHETQLMIKEANQRCRDIGVSYEFKYLQLIDEFGIFRSVVNIIDRKNQRKAEWPIARLGVWLDVLRENTTISITDNTQEYDERLFKFVDIEWQKLDENFDKTISGSLNSSRISLNLNSVKEAIFKFKTSNNNSNNSFQTLKDQNDSQSNDDNINQNVKKRNSNSSEEVIQNNWVNSKRMLTYNCSDKKIDSSPNHNRNLPIPKDNDFDRLMSMYLKDLKRTTIKVRKLCDQALTDENSYKNRSPSNIEYFKKSFEQIDEIIYDLKNKITDIKLASPGAKTPKSVKFLLE